MNSLQLRHCIDRIFADHLQVQPPEPGVDLIESGVIDSLSFVELLAQLEQEFAIRIPLEELDVDWFRTISRICEFINAQIGEGEVVDGSYTGV